MEYEARKKSRETLQWRSGTRSGGRRKGKIPKRICKTRVLKTRPWRHTSSVWNNLLYYLTEKLGILCIFLERRIRVWIWIVTEA